MLEIAGLGIVIYLIGFALWIYAFIKTLMGEFKSKTNKIVWIIALIFLPPSALLFPFIGLKQLK